MKTLIGWSLIALALTYGLSGCAFQAHEIKVIKSNSEISVKTLDVNKGDVIICDNERCKVVEP